MVPACRGIESVPLQGGGPTWQTAQGSEFQRGDHGGVEDLWGAFHIPAKEGGGNLVSRPAGRFLVSPILFAACVWEDRPPALL
jgi:hypothetical protein